MAMPGDREELVPERIDCIDCGGPAFLVTRLDDEDPVGPGDILSYRCRDCLDQWYLEIPGADDA